MKKLLCVTAALVLCLTGCSEKAETSAKKGPVEIEFWHALGGSLGDGLNKIITDFNASQQSYIVKPVVIGSYSEIDEKLQAAYAANDVPALVVGGSQDTYYQKNLVVPFDDYRPADYDKSDIVGGFMKAAVRKGKMYYAPAYGTSQVLYYNKAILSEAGKSQEDLDTWQSLAGLSGTIIGQSTNTNTVQYVWEPMWGTGNIADMVSGNGGTYLSADGKTVLINTQPWVDVLEQIRVWLHDDKIMSIHTGGQGWEYWYKTMDDWVYGKALGYTGSPGDYTIALAAVKKSVQDGCKNEFAVTHQPGWGTHSPAPYFSSLMYFIPRGKNISEAQKKGAAAFITFATNTKNTAFFSMKTGYVAVRKSVLQLPEYQEYLKSNPDADAALKQIDKYGVPAFIDPTGGAITTALNKAIDKVEIENVPAKEALYVAAKEAQAALDKVRS